MLADLAPDEPEVLGLQALLELQGSRTAARLGPAPRPCCSRRRTAPCGTSRDPSRARGTAGCVPPARCGPARPSVRYFFQASIAAGARRTRGAPRTPTGAASPRCTTSSPRAAPGAGGRGQPGRGPRPGARSRPRARRRRTWTPSRLGASPLLPSVRGDLLERAGPPRRRLVGLRPRRPPSRATRASARVLRRHAEDNRSRDDRAEPGG